MEAQKQVDVATFTQWVDAFARDQAELTAFYRRRFRDEFKPAVNAWIATRPLLNPKAPLTPFVMPQYKLAAQADADRLDAQAEQSAATVSEDIQRGSNYVLAVVLFAVSLFFAGISTRAQGPSPKADHARARLHGISRHRHLDRHLSGQRRGLVASPRRHESPRVDDALRLGSLKSECPHTSTEGTTNGRSTTRTRLLPR